MRYFLILIPAILWFYIQKTPNAISKNTWKENSSLSRILTDLGNTSHLKKEKDYTKEQVSIGEDLVKNGFTKRRKGSKVISVYYQCTSCHNLVQEDPKPESPDPQARLRFTNEKGIPFLQATTFWGIVNRESWYNGDYIKKYGSLVEEAKDDIEASIQLCAQECAQGRVLKQWEVDAIMAYFWELELKLSDLNLTDNEMERLNKITSEDKKSEAIKLLKSKYMLASPATFSDAPYDKSKGYEVDKRDPINGKLIYENSCLHCHDKNGVTEYELNHSKLSFKKLLRDMEKDNPLSFYQAIRYGTSAAPGYRPYMPHYTLERMSDQQVEDLRAYIEQEAM